MNTPDPIRIDRRVAIKWMLTAGAGAMFAGRPAFGAPAPGGPAGAAGKPASGYGLDPDLIKAYKPGDLWPLTFSAAQRRQVAALCDVVIPAEGSCPGASAVGVTDFIDEWVSAPYPDNARDAKTILEGLAWLDAESTGRFGSVFAEAAEAQRAALCEEISRDPPEKPGLRPAVDFFRRFRNLAAGGFYTTPEGMKDIGYVGNVPLARFDGPPADLVERLGLAGEVKW
jgi:Gluconate 2-dehydrogenase subunit 3